MSNLMNNLNENKKMFQPKLIIDNKSTKLYDSMYVHALREALFTHFKKPYKPPRIPVEISEEITPKYSCRQCKDCFYNRDSLEEHISRGSWILGYWCTQCFQECEHLAGKKLYCNKCIKLQMQKYKALQSRGLKEGKNPGVVKIFFNPCQLLQHMQMHNSEKVFLHQLMLLPFPAGIGKEYFPHLKMISEALMDFMFLQNIHINDWLLQNNIHKWWRMAKGDNPVANIIKKYPFKVEQIKQLLNLNNKVNKIANGSTDTKSDENQNSNCVEASCLVIDKNFSIQSSSNVADFHEILPYAQTNQKFNTDITFVDCGTFNNENNKNKVHKIFSDISRIPQLNTLTLKNIPGKSFIGNLFSHKSNISVKHYSKTSGILSKKISKSDIATSVKKKDDKSTPHVVTIRSTKSINLTSLIKNYPQIAHKVANKKIVLIRKNTSRHAISSKDKSILGRKISLLSRKKIQNLSDEYMMTKQKSKRFLSNKQEELKKNKCKSHHLKLFNDPIIRHNNIQKDKLNGIINKKLCYDTNYSVSQINIGRKIVDLIDTSDISSNIKKFFSKLSSRIISVDYEFGSPTINFNRTIKKCIVSTKENTDLFLSALRSTTEETLKKFFQEKDFMHLTVKKKEKCEKKYLSVRNSSDTAIYGESTIRRMMFLYLREINKAKINQRINHLQSVSRRYSEIANVSNDEILNGYRQLISLLENIAKNDYFNPLFNSDSRLTCSTSYKMKKPSSRLVGFSNAAISDSNDCVCHDFICYKCQTFQGNEKRLYHHLRYHESQSPYVCPECDIIFSSSKSLNTHMWTECLHPLAKRFLYCKICNIHGFYSWESIVNHFVAMHSFQLSVCNVCCMVFDYKRYCIKHMKKTHSQITNHEEPLSFIMCQLDNNIIPVECYYLHIKNYAWVQEHKFYYCTLCSVSRKLFKTEESIKNHLYKFHFLNLLTIMDITAFNEILKIDDIRQLISHSVSSEMLSSRILSIAEKLVDPFTLNKAAFLPKVDPEILSETKNFIEIIEIFTEKELIDHLKISDNNKFIGKTEFSSINQKSKNSMEKISSSVFEMKNLLRERQNPYFTKNRNIYEKYSRLTDNQTKNFILSDEYSETLFGNNNNKFNSSFIFNIQQNVKNLITKEVFNRKKTKIFIVNENENSKMLNVVEMNLMNLNEISDRVFIIVKFDEKKKNGRRKNNFILLCRKNKCNLLRNSTNKCINLTENFQNNKEDKIVFVENSSKNPSEIEKLVLFSKELFLKKKGFLELESRQQLNYLQKNSYDLKFNVVKILTNFKMTKQSKDFILFRKNEMDRKNIEHLKLQLRQMFLPSNVSYFYSKRSETTNRTIQGIFSNNTTHKKEKRSNTSESLEHVNKNAKKTNDTLKFNFSSKIEGNSEEDNMQLKNSNELTIDEYTQNIKNADIFGKQISQFNNILNKDQCYENLLTYETSTPTNVIETKQLKLKTSSFCDDNETNELYNNISDSNAHILSTNLTIRRDSLNQLKKDLKNMEKNNVRKRTINEHKYNDIGNIKIQKMLELNESPVKESNMNELDNNISNKILKTDKKGSKPKTLKNDVQELNSDLLKSVEKTVESFPYVSAEPKNSLLVDTNHIAFLIASKSTSSTYQSLPSRISENDNVKQLRTRTIKKHNANSEIFGNNKKFNVKPILNASKLDKKIEYKRKSNFEEKFDVTPKFLKKRKFSLRMDTRNELHFKKLKTNNDDHTEKGIESLKSDKVKKPFSNIAKQKITSEKHMKNTRSSLINKNICRNENKEKIKSLSLNVVCSSKKETHRIAFCGGTDNFSKFYSFKCHLCNDIINTSWPILCSHFSNYHPNYKLCTISVKLTPLLKNIDKMNDSDIKIYRKRKSKIYPLENTKKRSKYSHKNMNKKPITSEITSGVFVKLESLVDYNGHFKCKKCEKRFIDINMLRQHIADNHRIAKNNLICLECGENFVVSSSLQMHLKVFHEISDPVIYMNQYSAYSSDIIHLQTENQITTDNQCYVCMAVFQDQFALDKHLRIHGMAFLKKNRIQSKNSLTLHEERTAPRNYISVANVNQESPIVCKFCK